MAGLRAAVQKGLIGGLAVLVILSQHRKVLSKPFHLRELVEQVDHMLNN